MRMRLMSAIVCLFVCKADRGKDEIAMTKERNLNEGKKRGSGYVCLEDGIGFGTIVISLLCHSAYPYLSISNLALTLDSCFAHPMSVPFNLSH